MRNMFVVFMTAVIFSSCSNYVYDLRGKFDESSTFYNNMIRWNEVGKASLFLSDAKRAESLERLQTAARARIVDSRVISSQFYEEKRKATVEVEIDYYLLTTSRVKTLRDKQEWAYLEDQGASGWRVVSPLPEFK